MFHSVYHPEAECYFAVQLFSQSESFIFLEQKVSGRERFEPIGVNFKLNPSSNRVYGYGYDDLPR
jgi:hypothetical protein